jgi:excisionase family DNA binding protein
LLPRQASWRKWQCTAIVSPDELRQSGIMESPGLKALLEQPLLARDELAIRLGVSVDTIAEWTCKKRIPSFRFGRRCVRYSYPAVLTALSKFHRPPQDQWSRQLPKRRRSLASPPMSYQTELIMEGDQLLFPFVSQLLSSGVKQKS